jgi:hypothetical protein
MLAEVVKTKIELGTLGDGSIFVLNGFKPEKKTRFLH